MMNRAQKLLEMAGKKKVWKDLPAEDYGQADPKHEGIFGVTCPECDAKRDIYSRFGSQKRTHEYKCDNCEVSFRVIGKKVQYAL